LEFRSLFKNVFKKEDLLYEPLTNYTQMKMLNSWNNTIVPFSGSAYDDALIRSIIHCISTHVSKLSAKHIVQNVDGKAKNIKDNLDYFLNKRPNDYMSAFDMYYKATSQLLLNNNSFFYVQYDGEYNISAIYPLTFTSAEFLEKDNEVYVKFMFLNNQIVVPYTSLIHIRRHFCNNDLLGDSQTKATKDVLDLMSTLSQGLKNYIKNSGKFCGVLKYNTNVKQEDIDKQVQKFVASFGTKTNGIAGIDNKIDYQQITTTNSAVDKTQLEYTKKNILEYFNISEPILSGNYNENEWTSFYESVIEPIAIQLSQEFTQKLFTKQEKITGHEIVFNTNRLIYANNQTKVSMIKDLGALGIFTVNEARAILNLPLIDDKDADERQISLNYVKTKNQSEYQVGHKDFDKKQVDAGGNE